MTEVEYHKERDKIVEAHRLTETWWYMASPEKRRRIAANVGWSNIVDSHWEDVMPAVQKLIRVELVGY